MILDSAQVARIIKDGDSFLVVSHENPDCDAIGSLLALRWALIGLGKSVCCYNKSRVPGYLRFLPGSECIKNDISSVKNNYDAVFILDSADISRVGYEFESFLKESQLKNIVTIDHHITNQIKLGEVLLDVHAASTGIIIYRILKQLRIKISKEIATCLFTTIVGDTGSFRYSNTNSEALLVASHLVECGASPEKISEALFESEPERKVRLLALILSTLEMHLDGKVATIYVDRQMYEMTNTSREDTEGAVNFVRSIKGVEVAVFFKEEFDENGSFWKVSIRSKSSVDVSSIARCFGGGGHQKAAGFAVNGTIDEAKACVIGKLEKVLKHARGAVA